MDQLYRMELLRLMDKEPVQFVDITLCSDQQPCLSLSRRSSQELDCALSGQSTPDSGRKHESTDDDFREELRRIRSLFRDIDLKSQKTRASRNKQLSHFALNPELSLSSKQPSSEKDPVVHLKLEYDCASSGVSPRTACSPDDHSRQWHTFLE